MYHADYVRHLPQQMSKKPGSSILFSVPDENPEQVAFEQDAERFPRNASERARKRWERAEGISLWSDGERTHLRRDVLSLPYERTVQKRVPHRFKRAEKRVTNFLSEHTGLPASRFSIMEVNEIEPPRRRFRRAHEAFMCMKVEPDDVEEGRQFVVTTNVIREGRKTTVRLTAGVEVDGYLVIPPTEQERCDEIDEGWDFARAEKALRNASPNW